MELAKPWLKRATRMLVVFISTYVIVLLLEVLRLGAWWCVMSAIHSVHWLFSNVLLLCFVAYRGTGHCLVTARGLVQQSLTKPSLCVIVLYCVLFNALAFALEAAFSRV